MDSAKVVIVNNKIQYGEGDLNNEGKLKNTVYLSKLLDIEVIVDQKVIHPDSSDSIKFQIILDAITDTVTIQTQITGPLDLSAGILKKTDPPEQNVLINNGGSIFDEIPIYPEYAIPNYKRSFNIAMEYDPGTFPPGEYQFIPYIMVSYPNEIKVKYHKVPSKLLESLGVVGKELTTNFLNIPMVIDGGSFQVIQN